MPNPKTKSFFDEQPESVQSAGPALSWRDLELATKAQLVIVYVAKILAALGWSASFGGINQAGSAVFLADLMPLPETLENMSLADITNLALGAMAVAVPTVAFHFMLKHNQILRDPRGYFDGQPTRIMVAGFLTAAWAITIGLEVLSLKTRMDGALNTGPLPVLGNDPEFWPLALVSAALVLGSALLGLASAALSQSISRRHDALRNQ